MEQTGVDGPSVPKTRRGRTVTFGHYHVLPAEGRRLPRPWSQALFLDYQVAGNRFFDPARFMAAPLVAVHEGSVELLLGWDFVQFGPLQLPTPAFWSLRRERALSEVIPAPAPKRANHATGSSARLNHGASL